MKKLLALLGTIGLASSGASVVACGDDDNTTTPAANPASDDSNPSTNNGDGDENEQPKAALSTEITILELGELANKDEATIRAAIKDKNADLTDEELSALEIDIHETDASVSSPNFEGSVLVTFTLTQPNPLAAKLTVTDLGELKVADANTPTNEEIIAGVQAKNADLASVEVGAFTITDLSATGATVAVSGYDETVPVTFTLTQPNPLAAKLTVTDLGELKVADANTPTNEEIIAAVKDQNADLASVEVGAFTITDSSATGATVAVSGYDETVPVTFTLTQPNPLAAKLTDTDLGNLKVANATAPTNEEIIAAVKDQNADLASVEVGAFTITDSSATGATVAVSGYDETVPVTFTLTQPNPLAAKLTDTDLGNLKVANATAPTNEEIIAAVKDQNADLASVEVGAFTITDSSATGATVAVSGYDETVPVTFTLTQPNPLAAKLTVTDLGELKVANATAPTNEEIIAGVQAKNADLASVEVGAFTITDSSATGATVAVSGYDETVPVTFTLTQPNPLAAKLTVTDLGELKVANATAPTNEEIIAGVQAKNADLASVEVGAFTITDLSATGATVAVSGYDETVPVTFTLTQPNPLAAKLTDTDLGNLKVANATAPTNEEIIAAVKDQNADLASVEVGAFTITDSSATGATVAVSGYDETVPVTFTLTQPNPLAAKLTDTDLGNLKVANATAPTNEEIIAAVKDQNADLASVEVGAFTITDSSATGATVAVSGYDETVPVTFTLTQPNPLAAKLTVTDLGELKVANATAPTNEEIIAGVQAKNADLASVEVGAFTITDLSATGATVAVSGYDETVPVTFTLTQPNPLAAKLTVTDLGNLKVANATAPTNEEIIAAVKDQNADLASVEVGAFTITDSSATGATVAVSGYDETVPVTFTLTQPNPLAAKLTDTDLGNLKVANATAPTNEEIIAGVQAKNADLASVEVGAFTITDSSATGATVAVSGYDETVPVTFTLTVA